MNNMIKGLVWKFAKVFIMAILGQLLAYFTYIAQYHPTSPDQATTWLFGLIAAAVAGIIAAIKRAIQWDPEKV